VTNETIARSYAVTLFELARRQDGLEAFAEGMDTVVGLLDQNPSFRIFLETPRIADREKKDLLKKVFGNVLPRPLLNFLQVTVDKRRQRLLGLMTEEFHALLDEHHGRTHVTVTVARELDPETLQELSGKLSALLGR
jgi:F-type H+-transporting ATPase subunit delta